MRHVPMRAVMAVAGLSVLAACADPTGPVVGDWRGQEPSRATIYQTRIEVILDGLPGAKAGTYHYQAESQGDDLGLGDRDLSWTDHWEMRPIAVGGVPMQAVHLAHLAGAHINDFILTPRGVLVPQPNLATPDLSADAYRVALVPVPRDSFGYGRP